MQVWHFAPPEPILGIATRDPKEVVQTSVKVWAKEGGLHMSTIFHCTSLTI